LPLQPAATPSDQLRLSWSYPIIEWFIGPTQRSDQTSNARTKFRLYRSLRAVKVLLAPLCSTLTVLAPREMGFYRFAVETQLLF
jgi:hypothetical protein